jgi:hypothetical protein
MSTMKRIITSLTLFAVLAGTARTRGDEVTDWNQTMITAFATAGVSPLAGTRLGAIVEGSVFDAVNGVERRYTPVHVTPAAPSGASARAAAIQAAYAALVALFPAQKATLDAQLAKSLDALRAKKAAIAAGRAWGQTVAEQILAWRAADGITPPPPPYLGGTGVGQWRRTPPGNLSGAGVAFATMLPWVMSSPFQFRPPGPPALDSLQYAQDFVETKRMGRSDSPERSADETLFAKFWNADTVAYFWNTVAQRLSQQQGLELSQNARLFAHLNIGMADAGISCFDAKYHYSFWRPITAITLGDTDGNEDTVAQPSWLPLLDTPNHPDYPSGHSTVSGGATTVLASYFGLNTPFWIDASGLPGVVRSFANFDEARDEIANARIFAGIHFRTACVDGFAQGTAVGNYVLQNSLQPTRSSSGNHHEGDDQD